MGKTRKVSANYFRFVNPLLMILTVAAVGFLGVTYVDHKLIKPSLFGPIAEYAEIVAQYRFYLKISLLALAALHLFETLVAVYKCYRLRLSTLVTVAWTLQTLLFGIFSLCLLLWPSKGKSHHQQKYNHKQKGKQNGGGKQNSSGKQNNKQNNKGKQAGGKSPKSPKSRKED